MSNVITHDGLLVCVDCTMVLANGAETDEQAAAAAAMAAGWDGVGGLVLACPEDCDGEFSSRDCDGCGSPLAGDRHPAVAFGL